jgi:hypothetical protein
MLKVVIKYLFLVNIIPAFLAAQSLESVLVKILQETGNPQEYTKNYLKPMATSIGISLGSGLYHAGAVFDFPHVEIGAGASYIPIPPEAKYFTGETGQDVPTVFGKDEGPIPGYDKSAISLWIVQANIGLFGDIEANVRYSKDDTPILGKTQIFGAGFRYGLSSIFIPETVPMDLSVQAFYHYFLAGEYLASGAFNMNIHGSYSLFRSLLSLTAAVAFDNSSIVIKTNNLQGVGDSGVGDISIIGENGVSYHLGLNLELWRFSAFSEFRYGTYNSWYAGIYFGF